MRLRKSDLEVEVLYNRIRRGDLDLQPDYQRGEVWDTARRQRLVDTILRGWYVPAIHVVRDDAGFESILDGQQRLRTIQAFMNNVFRFSAKIEPPSEELEPYDGYFFDQLPETLKKRFQRFEISVVTLTDYEPAEPSELFFRLNQQYALTPSEKRNALFGAARDQVKDVVSTLVEAGLLKREVVGFSNGRLAYDDVMARVCVALEEGTLRRQLSNTYIEQFYRSNDFSPSVIRRACDAGIALGATLGGRKIMRFNKATLFTWLVFTDHVIQTTGESIPEKFIRNFEGLRTGTVTPELPITELGPTIEPDLIGVVKAYNDRSSYRVLDVSSVLLRDFALHILHEAFRSAGRGRFADISARLKSSDDAEHEMLAEIERINWGADL
ncbi:DUF262 domain-containing protein [Streptomyces sp. HUAS ZL42]|uniref:DUF262 domain-containing protein n=1 Tax=Streptomyces sp. HUAS ZL42 TaxID=3231715 RepID=UPI00345F099F